MITNFLTRPQHISSQKIAQLRLKKSDMIRTGSYPKGMGSGQTGIGFACFSF